MPKIKTLKTNFNGGEASPRLDGRPDLAKYQNMASVLENYLIFPQGGIFRRYGTRIVAECKDSAALVNRVAVIRPFIFSRTDSFVLEFGHLYIRFYKSMAQLLSGAAAYELVSPYTADEVADLHFAQSADVLFIDHPNHTPQKLSRSADTNWTIGNMSRIPPPTEEVEIDLNTPLQPGANANVQGSTDVPFSTVASVFLPGDVDRNIVSGSARAAITSYVSATNVKATILDAFPSLAQIQAGHWVLDRSPSSEADADKKTHLGQTIDIRFKSPDTNSDQDAIRAGDVGKYIKILGGIVRITLRVSASEINGHVEVALKPEQKNPDAVAGGDWTLESDAWTDAKGWPRTPAFFQGRLFHAGWNSSPGSFIGSASDDFENYGVGSHAADAIEYTISRQQATIIGILDLGNLVLVTPESVFAAFGSGNTNTPLGGDNVPLVVRQDAPGAMSVQPIVTGITAIYIDAATKRVRELRYSPDQGTRTPYVAQDLTLLAEHICGKTGFKKDRIGWAESPFRTMYFPRNDGQLAALTYYNVPEQVVGWSRVVTDGIFESICVIPHPNGDRDQVWAIVRRNINGVDHRYIEYFEDDASEFQNGVRAWTPLYTDSAKVYSGAAVTNVPTGFLAHLEGKEVDVVADKGLVQSKGVNADGTPVRFRVLNGKLDAELQETHTLLEIGLHYDSTLTTMRPAVEGAIIEDGVKMYDTIMIKFQDSIGCVLVNAVNGKETEFLFNVGGQPLDAAPPLFTGNKRLSNSGWDDVGRITLKQRQPLPQTILGMALRLNTGSLD
jgi:hypothetical protein